MFNLLLLIYCVLNSKEESISFNITEYAKFRPIITLSFPNEKNNIKFYINTYLTFSTVKFSYSSMITDRILNNQTLYLEGQYKSVLYTTNIKINEHISINNISIYNVDSSFNMYYKDLGLALGYHIKENSFSIVHKLYDNNFIDHLQFAFKNIKHESDQFYIGGIPNNEHLNLPYKATIKVNETLPTWGFTIDKIIINGKEYNIGLPAIISSASDSLFISDDLYNLFKDNILKEEIEEGLCQLSTADTDKYIQCIEESLNDTYGLVINNIKFEFSTKIFQKSYYGVVESNYEDHKAHNFTGIILGPHFISQFNYTLFDYEKKQIEFYSDTSIITTLYTSNTIIKLFLFIEYILLLFNLMVLIYSKLFIL